MDFNDATPNTSSFDLIPANTVAKMIMTIRPGGSGDDGENDCADCGNLSP